MNIRFVEDKKNSIVFEIEDVSHGFCNLLKEELVKDKSVKLATYRIDHPVVGIPRIRVDGDDPKKSVKTAIKALKKETADFKKESSKLK